MKNSTFRLIAALVFLAGCGDVKRELEREAELYLYTQMFSEQMYVSADHVSLRFSVLNGVLGRCASWSDGSREITIDPILWNELSDLGKQQVMFHELGHCTMGLKHDDTFIIDPITNKNIEASIMNPYFFGHTNHWANYINEYKQALREHRRIHL